jgi:8-oxo-dGTP pyrophosphatase MutT (NUDIX family)
MSPFTLRRSAARVVLLDARGHVLLINASDPADRAKPPWWEIPGGGMDPHESSAEAAARELWEEAGIRDAQVGPCVWVQHAKFSFGGFNFDQHERVHIAWLDREGDADRHRAAGLEALEAMAFNGHRWWDLDELLASDVPVLPHRLRDHLPDLVAGRLPDPPVDITWPAEADH